MPGTTPALSQERAKPLASTMGSSGRTSGLFDDHVGCCVDIEQVPKTRLDPSFLPPMDGTTRPSPADEQLPSKGSSPATSAWNSGAAGQIARTVQVSPSTNGRSARHPRPVITPQEEHQAVVLGEQQGMVDSTHQCVLLGSAASTLPNRRSGALTAASLVPQSSGLREMLTAPRDGTKGAVDI